MEATSRCRGGEERGMYALERTPSSSLPNESKGHRKKHGQQSGKRGIYATREWDSPV